MRAGSAALGVLAARTRVQASAGWEGDAHALELALDSRGRWRAETAFTGDAGTARRAPRARRPLSARREPARAGTTASHGRRRRGRGVVLVCLEPCGAGPEGRKARAARSRPARTGAEQPLIRRRARAATRRTARRPCPVRTPSARARVCGASGAADRPRRCSRSATSCGERARFHAWWCGAQSSHAPSSPRAAAASRSRTGWLERGENLYLPEPQADRLVLRASSGAGSRTRAELRVPPPAVRSGSASRWSPEAGSCNSACWYCGVDARLAARLGRAHCTPVPGTGYLLYCLDATFVSSRNCRPGVTYPWSRRSSGTPVQNEPAHHRRVVRHARARQGAEAQGRSIVHLGIGEPDFDTPAFIRKAADDATAAATRNDRPAAGLPDSGVDRQHLARAAASPKPPTSSSRPAPSPFSSSPCSRCSSPVSQVVPEPAFPTYASVAEFLGARVVPVPLVPARGFDVDVVIAHAHHDRRSRTTVSAPTAHPPGAPSRPPRLDRAIAELAKQHDLLVMSDDERRARRTKATACPSPRCPAWPSAPWSWTGSPRRTR